MRKEGWDPICKEELINYLRWGRGILPHEIDGCVGVAAAGPGVIMVYVYLPLYIHSLYIHCKCMIIPLTGGPPVQPPVQGFTFFPAKKSL